MSTGNDELLSFSSNPAADGQDLLQFDSPTEPVEPSNAVDHHQVVLSSNEHPIDAPTNSSIMITNLDDVLMDEDNSNNNDDDNEIRDDASNYLLNTNYRRPIQEDILYEVEHENSFSDHSQNTSSIAAAHERVSHCIVFVID